MSEVTPSAETAPNTANAPLDNRLLAIAVVVLLGFAALVVYLLLRAGPATELEWTRSVYLFGSVEAITFAAAGFVFGREVHRRQAESAEARADEAQSAAQAARQEAAAAGADVAEAEAKGRALTAAIAARAQAVSFAAATPFESGDAGEKSASELAAAQALQDLLAQAQTLFPAKP